VELLPATRLEIRRGAGYILAMIEASALLHQYQRQETGDGELIATTDDYRLARALLSQPLGRLLGRQVSDGAVRFLGRLVEWYGVGGEYSIPRRRPRKRTLFRGCTAGTRIWLAPVWSSGRREAGQRAGPMAGRQVRPDQAADSLTLLPEAESLERT